MGETEEQIAVEEKQSQKIIVPPGEFRAPGDYRIIEGRYSLNGQNRSLELIQQTSSGNCAEYTTFNAVKVLEKEGFAVNPDIARYINTGNLSLDSVESDLVIPTLLDGQEAYKGIETTLEDVDNLVEKASNPYEPLTNTNSALLFRMATSPETSDFKQGDLVIEYSGGVERTILSNEILAIFVGHQDHATCYLKFGEDFLYIDPYFNKGVVVLQTKDQALGRLSDALDQPGTFITLNQIRVK
ncbi:hypothetical protein HY502_02205 [Candidatus Woesebacteria bacterium]|nr:hypothetical protein [Candidatus Woesebacteria bacterium]